MTDKINKSTVVSVAGTLLLIALVIPFVIFAVPAVVGADASHVVLSGSMQPALSPGDVVIVDDVEASAIGEGDIITYGTQGSQLPTTHRVVEVVEEEGERAFRTKGDANEAADANTVPPGNVEGKVMLAIPLIGHVIFFASRPEGAILFIGIPLGLLILSEIANLAFEENPVSRMWNRLSGGDAGSPAVKNDANKVEAERSHQKYEPENVSATESSEASDSDTYTITRADLEMSLPVMGLFAAYADWIFYQRWIVAGQRTPIPITVAIATTAGLLLLGAIYIGMGSESPEGHPGPPDEPQATPDVSSETPSASSNPTEQTNIGVASSVSRSFDDDQNPEPVATESIVELIDKATTTQTPIEWRPWVGEFNLATSTEMFVYASEREATHDGPARDESSVAGSDPAVSASTGSRNENEEGDGEAVNAPDDPEILTGNSSTQVESSSNDEAARQVDTDGGQNDD